VAEREYLSGKCRIRGHAAERYCEAMDGVGYLASRHDVQLERW
jgi:hypothetical protein